MGIADLQIFIALVTALLPAFFAFKLGRALNK